MKAVHQYKKQQGVAATRSRLGFTQQMFAQELGISRSLLSKAESRNRSLPVAALARLAAMEIRLAAEATSQLAKQAPEYTKPAADTSYASYAALLIQYKQMHAIAEAEKLECRLKIMETRYRQYQQSLAEVDALVAGSLQHNHLFMPGCLELHRLNLLRKINQCSIAAQAALRHKIAMLYASAQLHAINAKTMERR